MFLISHAQLYPTVVKEFHPSKKLSGMVSKSPVVGFLCTGDASIHNPSNGSLMWMTLDAFSMYHAVYVKENPPPPGPIKGDCRLPSAWGHTPFLFGNCIQCKGHRQTHLVFIRPSVTQAAIGASRREPGSRFRRRRRRRLQGRRHEQVVDGEGLLRGACRARVKDDD